jgi:outer membrane protein assembly factor BamB
MKRLLFICCLFLLAALKGFCDEMLIAELSAEHFSGGCLRVYLICGRIAGEKPALGKANALRLSGPFRLEARPAGEWRRKDVSVRVFRDNVELQRLQSSYILADRYLGGSGRYNFEFVQNRGFGEEPTAYPGISVDIAIEGATTADGVRVSDSSEYRNSATGAKEYFFLKRGGFLPEEAVLTLDGRRVAITSGDVVFDDVEFGMLRYAYSSAYGPEAGTLPDGRHAIRLLLPVSCGAPIVVDGDIFVDNGNPGMAELLQGDSFNDSMPAFAFGASDGLSGIDASSASFSIDGARHPHRASDGGYGISYEGAGLAEGSHRLEMSVADMAGNVTTRTRAFAVDLTPPVFDSPVWHPAGYTNGDLRISLAADDPAGSGMKSIRCRLKGSPEWSDGSLDVSDRAAVSLVIRGVKQNEAGAVVEAEAVDRAGNLRRIEAAVENLDLSPPALVFSSQGAQGAWANSASVSLLVTASDAKSGVKRIEAANQPPVFSSQAAVTVTTEGANRILATAFDNAGNSASAECLVNIDRTPPRLSDISIQASAGKRYLRAGLENDPLNAGSVSPLSRAVISLSGPAASADLLIGASELEEAVRDRSLRHEIAFPAVDGSYTLSLSVTDAAGNASSASGAPFVVDRTPPAFQVDCEDLARRQADGSYRIAFSISGIHDALGSVSPGSWAAAVSDSSGNAVQGASVAFGEGLEAKQCRADFPASSSGRYSLRISCADSAGNAGAASDAFEVDTLPPALSWAEGVSAESASAPWMKAGERLVAVCGDADVPRVVLTVDGALRSASRIAELPRGGRGYYCEFSQDLTGIHSIAFRAVDGAGNESSASGFLRIDAEPPQIALRASGYWTALPISPEASDPGGSGVDGASWKWRPDGSRSAVASDPGWRAGRLAMPAQGASTLSFLVKDAVGNERRASFPVSVDSERPLLSAGQRGRANAENRRLALSLSASDATSGIASLAYSLDGAEGWIPLPGWNGPDPGIDLSSEPDGSHRISLRASDGAGNASLPATVDFILDTLPPLALVETMSANGIDVPDGGNAQSGSLVARMASSGSSGAVAWSSRLESSGGPWSPFGAQSDIALTGLAQGFNVIAFRARDEAGNVSAVARRSLWVDSALPGAPLIKSRSHPPAVAETDAVQRSDASFEIIPSGVSPSGIGSCRWELHAVGAALPETTTAPMRAGEIVGARGGGLLLNALPDNGTGEFYLLRARSVAGNGLIGPWSSFRFRIDSRPPQGLALRVLPQADPEAWYGEGEALVRWNRPADMTGVRSYRYFATSGESDPDPAAWARTAEESLRLDLKAVLGASGHGRIRVGVRAEDYSGNAEYAQTSFLADIRAPDFPALEDGRSMAVDVDGSGARIAWAEAADSGSGLSGYEFELRSRPLSAASRDATVIRRAWLEGGGSARPLRVDAYGLEGGFLYGARVRAFDMAGNSRERSVFFLSDGSIPDVSVAESFSADYGAYRLSGSRTLDGAGKVLSYSGLSLALPEEIGLRRMMADGGAERMEPLRALELPDDGLRLRAGEDGMEFLSGSAASGSYEIISSGYVFRSADLEFERESGLAAIDAKYLRPVGSSASRAIEFGRVEFGLAPLSGPSSSLSSIDPALSFSLREKGPSGPMEDGLGVRGVGRLRIAGGRERADGAADPSGTVLLDVSGLAGSGIGFRRDGAASDIALNDLSMGPGCQGARAEILTEGLVMSLAGTDYRVAAAQLRGNSIVVLEARAVMPEGGLTLRNFLIDGFSGRIIQGPDFQATAEGLSGPMGIPIGNAACVLDQGGRLSLSGDLDFGVYGLLAFSDLGLSRGRPDWENGARLESLAARIHGFTLRCVRARLCSAGLSVDEGSVEVLGEELPFGGLCVDRSGKVVAEGRGNAALFPGSYPRERDFGYGAPIGMLGLRIGIDDLRVDFSLPLAPAFFPGSGGRIAFDGVRVDSGGFSGRVEGSRRVTAGGWEGRASALVFKGNRQASSVELSAFSVGIPGDAGTQTAEFSGLALGYSEIAAAGNCQRALRIDRDGWTIDFGALSLDGTGLGGSARLGLPCEGKNDAMLFPSLRMEAGGAIRSGEAAPGSSVTVGGWDLLLSGTTLAPNASGKLELGAARAVLGLAALSGSDIGFEGLSMDSSGGIRSIQASQGMADFTSANGYRISPTACRVGSSGISFSGDISCAAWPAGSASPRASYADFVISLSGDGVAASPAASEEAEYSRSGFSLAGSGFVFGPERLAVGASSWQNRGSRIELGPMEYYPDGSIAKSGRSQERMQLELFGGRLEAEGASLGDSGIGFDAFLRAPEALGDFSVGLEGVLLRPDGSLAGISEVERLDFAKGGFSFSFQGVRLADSRLEIDRGSMTLPESCQNARLDLRDFRIGPEGEFSLGGASADPFRLWGMSFEIEDVSCVGGIWSLEGWVAFPEEAPGQLSGCLARIEDFRIDGGGNVIGFDIALDGEFLLPCGDSWSVRLSGLGASYDAATSSPRIVAGSAALLFPEGFQVDELELRGLSLDLRGWSLDFESARAAGAVELSLPGLRLILTEMAVSREFDVTFKGKARASPDVGLPEFIVWREDKPTELDIREFTLNHDGTFGGIDIRATGLRGDIGAGLYLDSATAAIEKKSGGDGFIFSLTEASARVGAGAPFGLAGMEIALDAFRIDCADGAILELRGQASPGEFSVFGARIVGLSPGKGPRVSLAWSGESGLGEISVSGRALLPQGLPESIRGTCLDIEALTVLSDGTVKAFAMSAGLPGLRPAFGGIYFKDIRLGARLSGGSLRYEAGGSLVLGEDSFPEGIGGAEFAFEGMAFDQSGSLASFDADCRLPDQEIFGNLPIKGFELGLSGCGERDLVVSVKGDIYTPDSFPEGLRGRKFSIRSFEISSGGTIRRLDCAMSGLDADLFSGSLGLRNMGVAMSSGASADILFSISGDVVFLSRALPPELRGASLKIKTLVISSALGLVDFRVSLASSLEFDVGGGILARVSRLDVGMDGLSFGAQAILPDSYPEGLAGMRIDLDSLRIGWDGSLRDIRGGVGAMAASMAGFELRLDRLYFEHRAESGQNVLTMASCLLVLPENFGDLGGQCVGVRDAYFVLGTNEFKGSLVAPALATGLAGFRLTLESPAIDLAGRRISFSSARLRTPDLVGGQELVLNGVSLSPAGLRVSGAKFSLPDFCVAGGLGFKGVAVEFVSYDTPVNGEYFSIEGGGSVLLPGVGTLGAQVSFTNRTAAYPIGLKRAYFEFYAYGPGLALGTTGLFLNGIRGGFSYGTPDEVPGKVRYLFPDQGPRLQLGLRMVDQSGGSALCADADVWVDLSDWAFAFKGEMTLLKGTFNLSAEVVAALSQKGFYAGMQVTLVFIRGELEIYVFPRGASTCFAAAGSLKLGIPPKLLCGLPEEAIWLFNVNAEFGSFSSPGGEKKGFKASVSIPMLEAFGSIGVFVDETGKVSCEDLTEIKLIKPEQGPSARRGEFSMSVADASAGAARLERIVFACMFRSGDPDIEAVSPSGRRYREGMEGVEIRRTPSALFLTVMSPEAGEWRILADGSDSPDFEIRAVGKEAAPGIALSPPLGSRTVWTVSGRCDRGGGRVRLYLSEVAHGELGDMAAEADVREDGSFSAGLDVKGFPDGEYRVSAAYLREPEKIWPRAYAEGSVKIDRSGDALVTPSGFIACQSAADDSAMFRDQAEQGSALLYWDDNNGYLASAYAVESRETGGTQTRRDFVGKLSGIRMPGRRSGESFEFRVLPIDASGSDGPATPWACVRFGQADGSGGFNAPLIAVPELSLALPVGGEGDATLGLEIASRRESGGAGDFLRLRITKAPEGISLAYRERFAADADVLRAPIRLIASQGIVPGTYRVEGLVENMGDTGLSAVFGLTVGVSYPEPRILRIQPESLRAGVGADLSIYGGGFFEGTRAYLDGEELPIGELAPSRLALRVPPHQGPGTLRLVLRGPGGREAGADLEVEEPEWRVEVLVGRISLKPGSSGRFVVGLRGSPSPGRSVVLEPRGLPEGIEVPRVAVSSGGPAFIELRSSGGIAPGDYFFSMEDERGRRLPFAARVTSEVFGPRIESLSDARAVVGQEISVYGYGFGQSGGAWLSGRPMELTGYGESLARVRVGPGDSSGMLFLRNAEGDSNGVPLVIEESAFRLRAEDGIVEAVPGQRTVVNFSVSGNAERVALSLSADPALRAALETQVVKPNASLAVSVEAEAGTAPGDYPVSLIGSGGNLSSRATAILRVREGLALEKDELPAALSGAYYSHQLKARNAKEGLRVEVSGGELPAGLSMDARGLITGRAHGSGSYRFEATARDASAIAVSQTYRIDMEEGGWEQEGRDGGKSRYLPTASPADGRVKWRSAPVGRVSSIVSGSSCLWALAEGGIVCLDPRSGGLRYRLPGDFSWIALSGGRFVALAADKALIAFDPYTGNEAWRREGVDSCSTDGNSILAVSGGGGKFIKASSGTLSSACGGNLSPAWPIVWRGGRAFAASGPRLLELSGSGTRTVFVEPEADILGLCADGSGFVLASAAGDLVSLGPDFGELARGHAGFGSDARLCLGGQGVLVSDGSGQREYARADFALVWESHKAGAAILAGEKAFVSEAGTLVAYNRFDGGEIWSKAGSAGSPVLSGDRLYAPMSDGRIACFDAPDNLRGADAALRLEPRAPDGRGGWYRTRPLLAVEARDAESRAEKSFLRVGSAPERECGGAELLPEGSYGISAYAIDDHGLKGALAAMNLRIDSGAPESAARASRPEGKKGWHLAPPLVELSASDGQSGLDRIEVRLDGADPADYLRAIRVDGEGRHVLSWKAVDRAGNEEAEKALVLMLDLSDPTASAQALLFEGIAILRLSGEDAASGIERLEYSLDGSAVLAYGSPLSVAESGSHSLAYRAVDRAGRAGRWERIGFEVSARSQKAGLILCPLTAQGLRSVHSAARPGMALWADRAPGEADGRATELPERLSGCEFVLWKRGDRGEASEFGSLALARDAALYMLRIGGSGEPFEGWSLVGSGIGLNQEAFPRGAALYSRAAGPGERIPVPALRDSEPGYPPLIMAKEAPCLGLSLGTEDGRTVFPQGEEVRLIESLSGAEAERAAVARLECSFRLGGRDVPIEGRAFRMPPLEAGAALAVQCRAFDDGGYELGRARVELSSPPGSSLWVFSPAPGVRLDRGLRYPLGYTARDPDGNDAPKDDLRWLISADGFRWESLEPGADGSLCLSIPPGLEAETFQLRMERSGPSGQVESRTFVYEVGR